MFRKTMGAMPGPLTLALERGRRWRRAWRLTNDHQVHAQLDGQRRLELMRYHLGRGRRARDAGRYEAGASEARKALDAMPRNPWALALLGQCLFRQQPPDLAGARRSLELARVLDPTNGYFVGLLLDVLDAQGDAEARADVLAWAWWSGAPVERWLPDGPPRRRAARDPAAPETVDGSRPATPSPVVAPTQRGEAGPARSGVTFTPRPVHA